MRHHISSKHSFALILDGRIVEAFLEVIERGFEILSVPLAWGCHNDALGPTQALTTQGTVSAVASGTQLRDEAALTAVCGIR